MAVLIAGTVVSFKSENLSIQKEYSLVLHGMKGTLAQIYPQLDSAGCQKLAKAHLDSLLKLGGNSAEEQGKEDTGYRVKGERGCDRARIQDAAYRVSEAELRIRNDK